MHQLANHGSAGLSSGRFDGLDRPLDLLDQIVQESTLVQKTLVSGRLRNPDFVAFVNHGSIMTVTGEQIFSPSNGISTRTVTGALPGVSDGGNMSSKTGSLV